MTEAALARIADPDGEGSRTFTLVLAEAALAAARASDQLRAHGIVPSPLAGVPVSVKDLLDIEGHVTTAGSAALRQRGLRATRDAAVVRRLRAAGAVVVGRTNMPEFAYTGLGLNPHFGTPKNPFDRGVGRIPGGSSSGAGVAVADGMSLMSVGSDTGGSIRIPAALVGVTGFKPTQARVSRDGCFDLSTSLDALGPLAGSVDCCALADAVLAEDAPAPLDALPLARVTLALPRGSFLLADLEAPVAAAFDAAVETLRRAGARVVELAPDWLTPEQAGFGLLHPLVAPEAHASIFPHIADRQGLVDPRILKPLQDGALLPGHVHVDALRARARLIAALTDGFAGVQAILAPTVPFTAPTIADCQGALYGSAGITVARNAALVNVIDGCGLSIPCQPAGKAPVGLMLVGLRHTDRTLLAVGRSVERALREAGLGLPAWA